MRWFNTYWVFTFQQKITLEGGEQAINMRNYYKPSWGQANSSFSSVWYWRSSWHWPNLVLLLLLKQKQVSSLCEIYINTKLQTCRSLTEKTHCYRKCGLASHRILCFILKVFCLRKQKQILKPSKMSHGRTILLWLSI